MFTGSYTHMYIIIYLHSESFLNGSITGSVRKDDRHWIDGGEVQY